MKIQKVHSLFHSYIILFSFTLISSLQAATKQYVDKFAKIESFAFSAGVTGTGTIQIKENAKAAILANLSFAQSSRSSYITDDMLSICTSENPAANHRGRSLEIVGSELKYYNMNIGGYNISGDINFIAIVFY